MSSGADVDLALRLAETAVATMVELKCANFPLATKDFIQSEPGTRNTGKRGGERGTLNLFELVRGDKVQSVPPEETDL